MAENTIVEPTSQSNSQAAWDVDDFQKEWIRVNEQVIAHLMANPDIEKIKQKVRSQGHVKFDDRDEFINLVNQIKYDVIYKKYGPEGSEGYEAFQKAWRHWHSLKGTSIPKPENMFEDNIYHLLFGSTPNPDAFLKDFDVNK